VPFLQIKFATRLHGTQVRNSSLSPLSGRSLTLCFEDERLKILQEKGAFTPVLSNVSCLCLVQQDIEPILCHFPYNLFFDEIEACPQFGKSFL